MKKNVKRAISIILAAMMVWSSMDVSALAADAGAETAVAVEDIFQTNQSEEISTVEAEAKEVIPSLGNGGYGYNEVRVFYGLKEIKGNGYTTRMLDNIDLRGAEYVKMYYKFAGIHQTPEDEAYGRYKCLCYSSVDLVDQKTNKAIAPRITIREDTKYAPIEYTITFKCDDGGAWTCPNAAIDILLKGIDIADSETWSKIYWIVVGYPNYNFKIDSNYNGLAGYRERIFTGENEYDNEMLVEYPKPYFTDGGGKHVEEMSFGFGQTVSASVWEGGGKNSQDVKADSNTLLFKGFKLAKPDSANVLSGFITNSASFTFDQNFLSKYKDYLSSDGTFTLVPVYEPKYQAVEFFNGYATVDGKADAKGVYEGFRSGFTQSATKLDTIRVSAKANSGYKVSYMILQSPTGAWYSGSKKWTSWATRSNSQGTENPYVLASAINYKGDIWNSSMTNAILNKNLCRVIIYYDNAATGSITMAPSPQSVNEGADGKLTFINGPGAEKNPILGTVVAAGVTFSIENVHLFKPYIFGATSKSGFHAYWKDGTLDTSGDGVDDIRIPGYEPFRNTFGDQFKFIPQLPVKNKVYYNFVKDVNVAKEVKSLPIKGYLLLNDQLLISGKKVQKGLGGITVFASGFKAGQEVTTDENGYYVLESNDRFKYYDLYDYNVTFTGENEAGTIGVVYSQNPGSLGNVIVDASADVDITDVKLLTEQDKKDGTGREYVTVDTSEAKLGSYGGYFSLPGGDRNYRLQMSAHRGSEVLTKGVLTFTNTDGKTVSIEGSEDVRHSGLFTFDFNPEAKGIGSGATARVAFTGNSDYLSRDVGIKVSDSIGRLHILTTLTSSGLSTSQALGASDWNDIVGSAEEAITLEWTGEFDDITDNLSDAYMDGADRVICVGFGRKVLSAGGEKDMLMNLARTAAIAQDEAGEAAGYAAELKKQIASASDADKSALWVQLQETGKELSAKKDAADKAQSRLDDKIKAIQSERRQQTEFDDGLPVDLGYSLLMTFGYDNECGKWYFKDMLCVASADADSDMAVRFDTGLGLSTGVNKHLSANGRATFVAEERQDLTAEGIKEKRYYITEDNKDSFDILSVAGNGENRRLDSFGRLSLDPEITLTGFSGLAGDLVQADVDGKADYDLMYGTTTKMSGACTLNASVKIRTMNYTDTIPIINGIYQTGESDSGAEAADSLGAGSEESYLSRSVDTLKTEDLSYLEGDDTWYGGPDVEEEALSDDEIQTLSAIDDGGSEAYSESALANRIAPDAGYEMVSLGDGRFAAVFLNAVQSRIRDKENAKAAYYTYYDGTEWSTPELLEDDGTLDLYPHIYSLNGNGAIVMWSTVAEEYKDSTDKIARQNALDLHGRFVNINGSIEGDILRITETDAADRAVGVSQNGDKLVIVYEKRSYKSSGEVATVGDMLYPESTLIVHKTYNLDSGIFEDGSDDGNADGQRFFDGYLPEIELYEDLDDTGYYREGGDGTTARKLDAPGAGMLLDSDMATYTVNGKTEGVLAYTVDIDGDLNSFYDRELYLAAYDFDTDSFAKPVILTGYNVNRDAAEASRPENSSPEFVAASDGLYLVWLKDGDIVSMNVTNLLQNENVLVKEAQVQGSSYRYIDKTPYSAGMSAAYEAPYVLVSGSMTADSDGRQTGVISAFDAETDGNYIYIIWPQAADDKPEDSEDGLKDIQMWGIRAEISEGTALNATSPVQITSCPGERYDDVAFGAYEGTLIGMASRIPSRMITQSEAREVFADSFDEVTFVPYAIWDDTGAAPVTFRINENGTAKIRNAGFTGGRAGENASFSLEIHNYGFSDLNGAKVTAVDNDGNSCKLYQYVSSETENGEKETITADEITINGLRGGESYVVTGSVPLAEDADNAGITIALTDEKNRPADLVTITRELASDITLKDISISDTGTRNLYKVTGQIANEGTARADAGVVNLVVLGKSQEKSLRQIEYPALMPGESYEFNEENDSDELSEGNENYTYVDGGSFVLLEVSDDDFAVTEIVTDDTGVSDDQAPDTEDNVTEELRLYAGYKDGTFEYRIPVREAFYSSDSDTEYSFITREIPADRLTELNYVTGVQIDAVKAATDTEGYLTGKVVSSGKSMITLEAGETVDIQAEILTISPRKGAQASVDEEGKIVQTSTGTEGLTYHYEYIGDNAEINTDGMLRTLDKGSGRLKVYVYPDNSEYVADNYTGDNTVVIEGEQFQSMDDEDSYGEDAFHKLPTAAIRTFVLDVNILEKGERTDATGSYEAGGMLYRIINSTDAAVCGLKDDAAVKTLTIPATVTIEGNKYNVTRIDAYAFNKDLTIEKVSIGKNVASIGSGAFEGCENLSKVTLDSALTQIGESAFKGCAKISSITLPAKLERIEAEAFSGCTGLKSLIIPASVTHIGDRAFYGCTGLNKITIKSEKLTGANLGKDVFLGVPQSAEFNLAIRDAAIKNELTDTFTDSSEQVTDKKGIVYEISSKADKTLTVFGLSPAAAAKLKSVSIPSNVTYKGAKYAVTAIGAGAFENHAKLTKITIPKTVTAIGYRAFADAAALKSAVIPASVETLGEEAYSGCVKLSKVTIAAPALTVGNDAFKNVPDTAVFKYAFKGDNALYDLRVQLMSQSDTFVSKAGLIYEIPDPDLTGVVLTGSTNKNIKNLSIPDTVNYRGVKLSVISVKDGAFAYHKALKKVVLGKNVFEIYPDAFAGCTALTSVTMKKVQNISFSAFTGCISLKKITIPKTVKEIGNEAFDGCKALEAVTIQSAAPTALNSVGADAFEDTGANAYFKITAKPADKETITTLLTEAGVDPTRIK